MTVRHVQPQNAYEEPKDECALASVSAQLEHMPFDEFAARITQEAADIKARYAQSLAEVEDSEDD